MKLHFPILLSLILILVLSLPSLAQDTNEVIKIHLLSGEYSTGPEFGYKITLHPSGAFEEGAWGCVAGWQDQGKYQLKDEKILFHSDRGDSIFRTAVAWNGKIYLIEDKETIQFCNNVNEGGKWFSSLLVSMHSSDTEAFVLFPIPISWREYIVDTPVVGKVIAVSRDGTITISLGEKHGVKKGMEFHVHDKYSGIEIIDVDTETSKARVTVGQNIRSEDIVSTKGNEH